MTSDDRRRNQRPRRLPGAPPPPLSEPDELTEGDAIARLAAQQDRELLDHRADYEDDPQERDPPRRWTPEEVGRLVLMVCAGMSTQAIGATLGRAAEGVKQKLHDVRWGLRPKTHAEVARMGAQARHRPRSVGPEQGS